MDIAPARGCLECGKCEWGFSLMDTNERFDLLTNKPLKFWNARSDCLSCGTEYRWKVDPDKPYPESYK